IVRPNGADAAGLNEPLLRAYLSAFRKTAADEGISAEPDLNAAFRVPGMFAANENPEVDSRVEASLVSVLEEALRSLNQFRSREGGELAAVIRKHNQSLAECGREIAEIRAQALPAFQNRLSERLKELLRNASVDPQRLAQEAALLADRSDIGEEI